MPRRAFVAVLLLAATGCGGTAKDDAATASPSATSPSAVSPKPTTTPLPAAADGTKLSACRDGKCEVQVSVHDVIHPPARYGLQDMTITKISEDGLSVVGTSPGAMVSFSGQRPGMTSKMNGLNITTVALNGKKAVIRLGH